MDVQKIKEHYEIKLDKEAGKIKLCKKKEKDILGRILYLTEEKIVLTYGNKEVSEDNEDELLVKGEIDIITQKELIEVFIGKENITEEFKLWYDEKLDIRTKKYLDGLLEKHNFIKELKEEDFDKNKFEEIKDKSEDDKIFFDLLGQLGRRMHIGAYGDKYIVVDTVRDPEEVYSTIYVFRKKPSHEDIKIVTDVLGFKDDLLWGRNSIYCKGHSEGEKIHMLDQKIEAKNDIEEFRERTLRRLF